MEVIFKKLKNNFQVEEWKAEGRYTSFSLPCFGGTIRRGPARAAPDRLPSRFFTVASLLFGGPGEVNEPELEMDDNFRNSNRFGHPTVPADLRF